mgnify:CR=1 FL=1
MSNRPLHDDLQALGAVLDAVPVPSTLRRHVLEAARRHGAERVIFASTGGAIYGEIPEGERIGYDLELDRQRFTVTESGIVVIPKQPRPVFD